MDNSLRVGELQGLAHRTGYLDCLVQWQFVFGGFLDKSLHIAARHKRNNDTGLAMFLADFIYADDVGVVAQATKRPRFAGDAGTASVIQLLGLDKSEGDITVKLRIVGEVDLLLPAFTEELLHREAAVGEGGGDCSGG